MAVQLREVACRGCDETFYVCRRCDCGRHYCSKGCFNKAREPVVRLARSDYAHSKKGRLNNLVRQRRFRARRRTAGNDKEKHNAVTDQSSQLFGSVISCSYDETLAQPIPTEQPAKAPIRPAILAGGMAPAVLAAVVAWGLTAHPERVAQCRFCGRWGVVVKMTAARGRFRRRPHGRYVNLRRRR